MRQFIQNYSNVFCSYIEVPSTFRTIATDDGFRTKYHYVKFPNTIFQFVWTHNSILDSTACWLTNEPVQFENNLLKINEILSLDNYNFSGTLCLPSKEITEIRDKKLDGRLIMDFVEWEFNPDKFFESMNRYDFKDFFSHNFKEIHCSFLESISKTFRSVS